MLMREIPGAVVKREKKQIPDVRRKCNAWIVIVRVEKERLS
jgi:hypothetical protein